jgi:CheY-like chemotaxis protein
MSNTVLIVDDSKLARIVAAKAIAAAHPDWKKIEAGNADEALALLSQEQVDLAVIDFNMPGRNGLELAEEIRKIHATMPIALATANFQDEIIAQARTIEVSFVAKPITQDSLGGFLSGAALKLRGNR